VLRGWGNYFRTGNADREFNKMDGFVVKSLRRWQYRRGGQRPTKRAPFTGDQLHGMGLHKLMGTVKYPAQATPRRSSLSRVPENGTHGCVSSEGWRVQWERKPTGAKVRSLVAWIAGRKETEFLKPVEKAFEGMSASHRAVTKVNARVASKVLTQGPSPQLWGEGSMERRRLTDAADHSGGVKVHDGLRGVDDAVRVRHPHRVALEKPLVDGVEIPAEAFEYRLGNRSALEWVIDQYQVSEDPRSGIRSDPNRPDDPEYIVRLVGQVVRVSLETVRAVAALPAAFA